MPRAFLIACLAFAALPVNAAMREAPVEWTIGKAAFRGVLVYDDATAAKRPGLVMVPNYMGVTPANVAKARELAGDDYVVLVADVYGAKVRPKDAAEAGRLAGELRKDRATLRTRAAKAVDVLRAQAGKAPLDVARIGAMGFCFGGTTALELARGGHALAGVVSLHGGLATDAPAKPGSARTPVLVLNGADDRGITDADIAAFGEEMDAAGADWQFVNFGGAAHCFAEADAGNDPASNCRYDPRSAKRAYGMLHDFFRERFAM